MASPGSFTSGQVLTAAEMNALPGGILHSATLAGGVVLTTGATGAAATVFTTSITVPTGRKVLVCGTLNYNTTNTINTAVQVTYDGPNIAYADQQSMAGFRGLSVIGVGTGDGAAQTITMTLLFGGAPGNTTVGTLATFVVMDIGQ